MGLELSGLFVAIRGKFLDQVVADQLEPALVDHTLMREFDQKSLWAPDRIHMSRQGHKRMAAAVCRRPSSRTRSSRW